MGGISIWQLAIVAVIVVLLFGTKKLRGIGGDLGGAIKGFKKAMSEDDNSKENIEKKSDASFSSEETDTSKTAEKVEEKA